MPSKTTLAIAVAFAASASVLAAPANYYGYSDLVERDYNDYADLEARFYDYEIEDLAARDDAVADPNAAAASQQTPVSPTVETPTSSAGAGTGFPHPHHRHHPHHPHHPHHHLKRSHTLRRRDLEDLDYFYARDDSVTDPNAAATSQQVPTTPTDTPPSSAGVGSGFPHPHHRHHPHHPHHPHHHLKRSHTLRRRDLEDVDLEARSLLSLFGIHHEAKLSAAEGTRLEGMEKDCEAITDKKKKKKCEKQVKKIKGLEKRLKYLNEAWEKETGKPLPPHAHAAGASSSATPAPASSSSPAASN